LFANVALSRKTAAAVRSSARQEARRASETNREHDAPVITQYGTGNIDEGIQVELTQVI